MPPPIFNPPKLLDQSSSFQDDAKVLTAAFGDGYNQRAPDGLNTVRLTGSFVFKGLTTTERDDILNFLRGTQGATAFYYTLPGELTARLFTAKTWQWVNSSGVYWDVTVEVEEQFDVV